MTRTLMMLVLWFAMMDSHLAADLAGHLLQGTPASMTLSSISQVDENAVVPLPDWPAVSQPRAAVTCSSESPAANAMKPGAAAESPRTVSHGGQAAEGKPVAVKRTVHPTRSARRPVTPPR
ncbi:MAG: hypothetical protein ACKOCX_07280 [Planctomycetota bacterium]